MSITNNAINASGAKYQNSQSVLNYTAKPADAGGVIYMTNNSASTGVFIDKHVNQAMPVGSYLTIVAGGGAGSIVTITNDVLVTIINNTNLAIGPNGIIELYQVIQDVWICTRIFEQYTHASYLQWGTLLQSTGSKTSFKIIRDGARVVMQIPAISTITSTQNDYVKTISALPSRFIPAGIVRSVNGGIIISGNPEVTGAAAIDTGGTVYIESAPNVMINGTSFSCDAFALPYLLN